MLSRAVASVFFEEHRPQKLPTHGLYAGVSRDSCLPCKRYCRAASRAAACRAPVALLVVSCVSVPLYHYNAAKYSMHGITYSSLLTEAEPKLEFKLTKKNIIVCLLWGFGGTVLCYNSTTSFFDLLLSNVSLKSSWKSVVLLSNLSSLLVIISNIEWISTDPLQFEIKNLLHTYCATQHN